MSKTNSSVRPERKQVRSEETRQSLLNSARHLMAIRNSIDVPLLDIAKHAKANVALISYHFNGKTGLWIELARDDANFTRAALDRLMKSNYTPLEKLALHVRGVIHVYAERPYLSRLMHHLIGDQTSESAKELGMLFTAPVSNVRIKLLEEGMKLGQIRKLKPSYVDFLIDGACERLFVSAEARQIVLGKRAIDTPLLKEFAEAAVDFVVHALKA